MAGRWLARHRPELADPAAWDYAAAARYVAAVDRMRVGEWSHQAGKARQSPQAGQPLAARTKAKHLPAMRVFFGDCQERLWLEIGRAHLCTPVTPLARMPSSA